MFIVMSLLFFAGHSKASTKPSIGNIKTVIEKKIGIDKLGVGVSVVIYQDNKEFYYNYGLADKESKETVTSKHIFEI